MPYDWNESTISRANPKVSKIHHPARAGGREGMSNLDIDIIRNMAGHRPTRDTLAFRCHRHSDIGYYTGKCPCPENEPNVVEDQQVKVGDLLDMILELAALVPLPPTDPLRNQ